MKLRNKKTGDITNNVYMYDGLISVYVDEDCSGTYTTLAELNKEWEDYKPAEPLIKDEKIRKAVRAWAEAENEDCYYGVDATTIRNGSGDHIEFWSRPFKDLKIAQHYTISELCGEEEE